MASQPAGGLIEGCFAGAFEGLAQQQRPPALIEALVAFSRTLLDKRTLDKVSVVRTAGGAVVLPASTT
jgi:hypothetical protein